MTSCRPWEMLKNVVSWNGRRALPQKSTSGLMPWNHSLNFFNAVSPTGRRSKAEFNYLSVTPPFGCQAEYREPALEEKHVGSSVLWGGPGKDWQLLELRSLCFDADWSESLTTTLPRTPGITKGPTCLSVLGHK